MNEGIIPAFRHKSSTSEAREITSIQIIRLSINTRECRDMGRKHIGD